MGDICARNVQSLHFYCFICWVYCGYGSQHPDRLVPEQQNYYPDYITEQTDPPLGLFCTSWMFRILPAKFFLLLFFLLMKWFTTLVLASYLALTMGRLLLFTSPAVYYVCNPRIGADLGGIMSICISCPDKVFNQM